MIKKILKFPFSKRGRIYTAAILMLFFLGNAYTKHKFHEKAVEELQTALKSHWKLPYLLLGQSIILLHALYRHSLKRKVFSMIVA